MKSILIGALNHSNRIRNEQVMAFECQLVGLPMYQGTVCNIIFQVSCLHI